MRACIVPLAVLVSVLVWRFAHGPLMPRFGFAVSAFTLLAAAHVGWRWLEHHRRAQMITATLGALVIGSGLIPDLWPCDIDCQGGYLYRALFGVPIGAFGVAGLLAVAFATARGSAWTAALCGALAGLSAYLLWVSWQLGMVCPYCLSVHTAVLATAALALRGLRWRSLVIAALAAMALHGLYQLQTDRVPDTDPVNGQDQPPTTAEQAVLAAIDDGRKLGDSTAPLILDLIIDFQCSHCAESGPAIIQAVTPAIEDKTVELVLHSTWRPRQPMSATLSRWSLAAALKGRLLYTVYVAAALGSNPDLPEAKVRERIGTLVDTADLDRIAEANRTAIDRFMRDESEKLKADRLHTAPCARLTERATGVVLQNWDGVTSIDGVTDAVERYRSRTANR